MGFSKKRLGDLLLESGVISSEQLDLALAEQRQNPEPLGRILVRRGLVSELSLLRVLAQQRDVPYFDLESASPSAEARSLLPDTVCEEHQVIPLLVRDGVLLLGMKDPDDVDALDLVRNYTRMRVEPVLVNEDRLMRLINGPTHVHDENEVVDNFVTQAMLDVASWDSFFGPQETSVLSEEDTAPVVGLVNQLLSDAIRMHASDVHIEPRSDRVDIRFRVDGHLLKVREIPRKLMPMIAARIKIMGELDIVEYRLPQDGRFSVRLQDRTVDLRVSILPNYHGQRIVLRILDRSSALKSLDHIGFSDHNLNLFRSLVRKPYGMFLVTGPTGSGKTTTLYGALCELQEITNNIMTCEDPIEYDIDGINQSQVFERIGLTFAAQLRAILRQDPDIILVGEIRDQETAETAIRAALTGHLVLSTLHANDAPSAIPRLIDMGVEPYLLSTSIIGVMAQRLLRVLCPHCKVERRVDESDIQLLCHYEAARNLTSSYHAAGCERCNHTGHMGRVAVHEILPITPEIAKLICVGAPVEQIREHAFEFGYRSMQEDAIDRVIAGQTSIEEAKRLIFFDAFHHEPAGASAHAA